MNSELFVLPVNFDLTATAIFALTGALIAAKRGFDFLGIFIIAVVSGAGGGILRDAIFLNTMPAFVTDWRYIAAIFVGIGAVLALRSVLKYRLIGLFILLVDSLALGMYGVFGTQKATVFGLSILGAIIVGVVSAIGGGLLREVLMGEDRTALHPGPVYGILAAASVVFYLVLSNWLNLSNSLSAWITIVTIFCMRLLAMKFDWQTSAVSDMWDPSKTVTEKSRRMARKVSGVVGKGNK